MKNALIRIKHESKFSGMIHFICGWGRSQSEIAPAGILQVLHLKGNNKFRVK